MEKYVVIRTDNEYIEVVSFEDDYNKAVDVMTDDFFEYLRNRQTRDALIELICGIDGFLDCVGGSIANEDANLWMNSEVSCDYIGHCWRVITVPFEEKKEN